MDNQNIINLLNNIYHIQQRKDNIGSIIKLFHIKNDLPKGWTYVYTFNELRDIYPEIHTTTKTPVYFNQATLQTTDKIVIGTTGYLPRKGNAGDIQNIYGAIQTSYLPTVREDISYGNIFNFMKNLFKSITELLRNLLPTITVTIDNINIPEWLLEIERGNKKTKETKSLSNLYRRIFFLLWNCNNIEPKMKVYPGTIGEIVKYNKDLHNIGETTSEYCQILFPAVVIDKTSKVEYQAIVEPFEYTY